MESICGSCSRVLNSKVEPLAVTLSAVVILHVQFVLVWIDFDGFPQVSRFKPGLELKSFVNVLVPNLALFVFHFLLHTVVRFES